MKSKIKKSIYHLSRKNHCFCHIVVSVCRVYDSLFHKGIIKKQVSDTIEKYIDVSIRTKKEINRLTRDIWYSKIAYKVPPDEYFLFEFERLSDIGRREFIGNIEKEELCHNINKNGEWKLFTDKYQTYLKFREYYRRDVILVQNESDKEDFFKFVEKHKKMIIKLYNSSKGEGVVVKELTHAKEAETIFDEIINKGICVVEEYIDQAREMAKFHPNSVNTIRFTTFVKEHKVVKLMCVLRMGCGGGIVDNGGSGGICAAVDVDTGIVVGKGTKENGQRYIIHPDSQEQILGIKIPYWEELNEMVEKLAYVIPEQKYVGWDMALTKEGWVMIEGNSWSQFVINQMSSQRGMRNIVKETLGSIE